MAIKTKGEHINAAHDELRISGLTVNSDPASDGAALTKLEDMVDEFEGRNICINYAFEDTPNPATSSGVAGKYNNMIATNLALRLAPRFGKDTNKPISPILRTQAIQSLANASALTAKINRTRYPERQPLGSGNTYRWNRWIRFYRDKPNPVISCETEELALNSIASYIATWSDWLNEGETITSFEIVETDGLEITNAQIQNSATEIFYNAKGVKCGAQNINISIVTSETTPDNADTRIIHFNVIDNLSTA